MRKYIGTKLIEAEPMQKDGKDGYRVKYEDGYESWSPADVFEKAYHNYGCLNFGQAIELLKLGKKAARA